MAHRGYTRDEITAAITTGAPIPFADLIDAIDAFPDPQTAFELATLLRKTAEEHVGVAATLRARQAQRIWKAEELSLSQLGRRIGGLSKERARKLLQDADNNPRPAPRSCSERADDNLA